MHKLQPSWILCLWKSLYYLLQIAFILTKDPSDFCENSRVTAANILEFVELIISSGFSNQKDTIQY